MRRRRDSRSPEPGGITAVLLIGTAVGLAAAGATFARGPLATALAIAVPTVVALLASYVVIQWRIIGPNRRLHAARAHELDELRLDAEDERRERRILRELDRGLDQAPSEEAALELLEVAFERHLPKRPMELHLVDPVEPVMSLVVATGFGDDEVKPSERTSPWDSVAARTGRTLVYESTSRLDVCRHLVSRLSAPRSAVAVPVSATDRVLGVLYGFGAENDEPTSTDVEFLEDLAAVISARVAVIRTGGPAGEIESVDRLTGLPDRATMQERVLRMLKDRIPFTVAVVDIDEFGALNESLGRPAGDSALQLLAGVARRTVRPDDILGRIGGDELLLVFPRSLPDDATRAVERLREELVLAQSSGEHAQFSLSIGVVGSTQGGSIDEILHRAAEALAHAKAEGGNRVVVAHPTPAAP